MNQIHGNVEDGEEDGKFFIPFSRSLSSYKYLKKGIERKMTYAFMYNRTREKVFW